MIDASEIAKGKKHFQIKAYSGNIKPLYDRVLVRDMHFGDTTTNGGIIILSDDGKDRGIHPRWAQVVRKGDDNDDPYDVGDWILVEHGRWTRGFKVDMDGESDTVECRIVEAKSVMMWSQEKPKDIIMNNDTIDLSGDSHRPEDFVR